MAAYRTSNLLVDASLRFAKTSEQLCGLAVLLLPKHWISSVVVSAHTDARFILPSIKHHVEREQIWPNAGFQEQLALFEMCQYMPSQNEGIYTRWRQNLDRQIRERGLR